MILELMHHRRSIRRFKPDPVPDDMLKKLVEAAVTAPSAGNKQPWRFIIVRQSKCITTAAELVEEECQRLSKRMTSEFRKDFMAYCHNFIWFKQAPALIVPVYRIFTGFSSMLPPRAAEKDRLLLAAFEAHSMLVSAGLAVQNILLMAEELGLGACCLTGPLLAADRLEETLSVPQGWQMSVLIALGFPDEQPLDPGRKPLESFMRWI